MNDISTGSDEPFAVHASMSGSHPLFVEQREKASLDLEHSAVDTDLPRLARKMKVLRYEITDVDSYVPLSQTFSTPSSSPSSSSQRLVNLGRQAASITTLLDPTLTSDQPSLENFRDRDLLIQDILGCLAEQLGTEQEAIKSHFLSAVGYDPNVDIHSRSLRGDLNRFFLAHFSEAHPLVLLLKSCNQSMLAPAVVFMKLRVNNQLLYKDHHGGWNINISFISIAGALAEVVVTHRKREICFSGEADPAKHFEFTWETNLHFDPSLRLLASELSVIHLFINSHVPADEATNIRDLLAVAVSAREPFSSSPLPPPSSSSSSGSQADQEWYFDLSVNFEDVFQAMVSSFNAIGDWFSSLGD